MKWLDRVLGRQSQGDERPAIDPFPDVKLTDTDRAYLSDKLAAVEKRAEILGRLRRLGYEFDLTTRRETDASTDR